MKIDLTGRRALITGASRGVGRAVAIAIAEAGAECVAETQALPCDLASPEELDAMLDALPHIDLFIHCASPSFDYTKLHELDAQQSTLQLQVGVHATTRICARLLPEMMLSRWGRVVITTSLASILGGRGAAPYNMVKAAQESLIRSIALEYGRYKICANALRLGPVDGERLAERDAIYPGARANLISKAPNKFLPTPGQIADVVTFFCSDQVAPINGATLDVSAAIHLNSAW